MTRFAAFPDIHDQAQQLKQIRYVLADVDAVLLAGDMTNGNVENLTTLLDLVAQYNEQIYAVCGNMDTVQMNMLMARQGISIHRKQVVLDDIAILGCGGALPFYGAYVFSEDELAGFLEDSLAGVPQNMPKILLCHQPPYDTKMDIAHGNHVGSKAVRKFIERVQPLICFTGHIHQAVGVDVLGKTQIINPGPIWRTKQYAYAEVENGEVAVLEMRQVAALAL